MEHHPCGEVGALRAIPAGTGRDFWLDILLAGHAFEQLIAAIWISDMAHSILDTTDAIAAWSAKTFTTIVDGQVYYIDLISCSSNILWHDPTGFHAGFLACGTYYLVFG